MIEKKIKVGVVGVGYLGRHHARIYSEMPSVELVGVVDIDKKRAEDIARIYQTIPYYDHTTFIEKESPDAVSIVVPTTSHFEIARDFLAKDIHILVEKPVTRTVEEAAELLKMAKSKNLILQVGHIERFNAAVQTVKNIVKDPIFIQSQRMGPYNHRINDVGVVLDLMIHDIDIILSLVKSPIREIKSFGQKVVSTTEDIASTQIYFENGCIAHILVSRVTEAKIRKLQIIQQGAYIYLDYGQQSINIYKQMDSQHFPLLKESTSGMVTIIERPSIKKEEPLRIELDHFIKCVKDGREPLVTIENGKKALEVALNILKEIEGNIS